MTLQQRQKTYILIPALLLVLSIGLQSAYAGRYGYEGTNPDGGEITKVKGSLWTYIAGLTNNNVHVDRIIYLTETDDFTVGVGYYDQKSAGTEVYKWLKYWDEGGTYDNQHWLYTSGPSTEAWHTAELYEVDSDTYGFLIDGSSIGTLDCHVTPCDAPTIAGVASWSSSSSTSDHLKANFKDLQHDDGSGYGAWHNESTDYKCDNNPGTLTFGLVGNMDQMQIEVAPGDGCNSNSPAWLYNGGAGG